MKPKRGRPKKKDKLITLSVQLDEKTIKFLRQIAADKGTSVSYVVRQAIIKYIGESKNE